LLLDNPYVLKDFWVWQGGRLTQEEWRTRLASDRRKAARALAERRTNVVLRIVLSRIYTLRNQLIHGGATWNGQVNRAQIRDCTRFMARLVPHLARPPVADDRLSLTRDGRVAYALTSRQDCRLARPQAARRAGHRDVPGKHAVPGRDDARGPGAHRLHRPAWRRWCRARGPT
jgi:hypothetical protein